MPQSISSFITNFYLINYEYLKHCVSYKAVHTNDTDLT